VKGGNVATLDSPRKNLTGDTYVTDGLRAVVLLSGDIAPSIRDALFTLKAFDWEWPDAISLDGSAPWHNPP